MKLRELAETLNTKLPTTWTTDAKGNKIGTFVSGEDQYRIHLQRLPIEDFNVIQIGFDKWDVINNNWSITATLSNKQAIIVISAIFHAISDEVYKHNFDALVFGAVEDVKQRMGIYNRIAYRYVKFLGNTIENLPGPNGSLWTIVCTPAVSRNFTKDEIMELAYPLLNK